MNIYKFTKYLQIASKDTKLSIWGDSTISVERPSSIRKRNATLVTSSWALFPNTKNSLKVYGVHGLLTQHSRICETVTWTEKRNRICLNQVRREHFSESYQPPLLKVGDSGAWRVTVFSVLILQAGFHPCGSSHLFSWWCDNKGWQHQPTNKGSKISVCVRACTCVVCTCECSEHLCTGLLKIRQWKKLSDGQYEHRAGKQIPETHILVVDEWAP